MNLKKWMALALAGTMCFSMLAACGGDEEEYVEDDEIVDEEVVEDDEEYVEDDEEYVEDVEEPEEDTPALSDQEALMRLAQSNALLIGAMNVLDEGVGGEENYPEDILAVLEDMKAVVLDLSESDPATMDADTVAAFQADFDMYLDMVLQYVEIDAEAILSQAGLSTSDNVDGPVSDKAWDTMNSMLDLLNKMVLFFQNNGAPEECGPYLDQAVEILTAVSGTERSQVTELDAAKVIEQVQPICEFLQQYIPMEE